MIIRRVYWMILIISVGIGVYFYGVAPEKFNSDFLIFFSLIPFLMFLGSVHGLINHLVRSEVKGEMIAYPLIMGALFVVMFLIHILVILPLVCPNFLS